jgi:hypothetical protein
MRITGREDGAALVTALMLTMLTLVIAMALLSTVITGTRISASQKRYRTALSAAQGGVELLTQEIIPRLFDPGNTAPGLESEFAPIDLTLPETTCLRQKLNRPGGSWSACSAAQSSDDPAQAPDIVFKLKGEGRRGFLVSSKILDAVPGNSDRNGTIDFLQQGNSVSGREEVVRPPHIPGMYNIAVQGEREAGAAREKARLSLLYAY